MALSVVYFRFTHRLGQTTLRVGRVSDDNVDDERKREGDTRKAPRGLPGLTSPSDGRIAINIHTAKGLGI